MQEKELKDRGYMVRAATIEDVDAVVELLNDAAIVDSGMVVTNRDDKLIEWGLPQVNIETDTTLILAPDCQQAIGGQRVVGYAELWDSEPHVRLYFSGRVHPDYRGQGIGTYLMAWAETRARQSVDKAPPEARVSTHTSTIHENEAAHELFRARGWTLSRHFYRMIVEMAPDAPPPEPIWPEGITVRTYALGQEDRAVHRTIEEAFLDHWGYVEGETFEEWFHWIEADKKFDPSVCFLAVTNGQDDEQIVGALMSRLEWERDPSVAWIDELGVLRPWRHKGIGLALLHQVFGEFHRRGRYKVGLGVDGNSLTGATRLYKRADMRIFRQNDAYEKILRPGLDLSTQAVEG